MLGGLGRGLGLCVEGCFLVLLGRLGGCIEGHGFRGCLVAILCDLGCHGSVLKQLF